MNDNPTLLYFEEHFEHCEGSLYDGEDFAYWLAERDVEVAKAERERIVELLKRTVMTVNMEWIVTLIEGENE